MEPSLQSKSNALLTWIHARQSHEMGQSVEKSNHVNIVSHHMPRKPNLSLSAQAAVYVLHKVKRLVAMIQLKQVKIKIHYYFINKLFL